MQSSHSALAQTGRSGSERATSSSSLKRQDSRLFASQRETEEIQKGVANGNDDNDDTGDDNERQSKGQTKSVNESSMDNDDMTQDDSVQDEEPLHKGFDYLDHWYPVLWERDLPQNRQAHVRVFDTEYLVVEIDTDAIDARASIGINTTDRVQYSSNGSSNRFFAIQKDHEGSLSRSAWRNDMIPASLHQGMIWIFPGGGNEQDVLTQHPIPSVPEMNTKTSNEVTTMIRDCPVDWSILVDNILDPENGLFSHGMVRFDTETVENVDDYIEEDEHPEQRQQDTSTGWRITTRVEGYERLITTRKERCRQHLQKKYPPPFKRCVVEFTAPSLITWKRTDDSNQNITSAFWVCPTGVGQCRLLSASIGTSSSVPMPRWVLHLFINKFLDRGSLMLAAQQDYLLNAERENALDPGSENHARHQTCVRKNKLVCNTPLLKLSIRVAEFWDATLHKVPNRIPKLLATDNPLSSVAAIVMDRERQHLSVCPDSQGLVRQCNRMRFASVALFLWNIAKWTARGPASSNSRVVVSSTQGLLWAAVLYRVASKLREEFTKRHTRLLSDRDRHKIPPYLQRSQDAGRIRYDTNTLVAGDTHDASHPVQLVAFSNTLASFNSTGTTDRD